MTGAEMLARVNGDLIYEYDSSGKERPVYVDRLLRFLGERRGEKVVVSMVYNITGGHKIFSASYTGFKVETGKDYGTLTISLITNETDGIVVKIDKQQLTYSLQSGGSSLQSCQIFFVEESRG